MDRKTALDCVQDGSGLCARRFWIVRKTVLDGSQDGSGWKTAQDGCCLNDYIYIAVLNKYILAERY